MKLRNCVHLVLIALGLASYAAWSRGDRQGRGVAELPPDFPHDTFPLLKVPLLNLDEAEALWHRDSTLFIDVRTAFDYHVGHIAGAVSLPENELDARFPTLQGRFERAEALVLYCSSPDCAKSYWAALRLHNQGFTRLHIYPEGWNEWSTRQLPIGRGD